MTGTVLRATVLQPKAVVYVRQSTYSQVMANLVAYRQALDFSG
jgi:hypothetical protein